MKTSLRSFFIAAILSVTAVCVQAAEVASEAVVLTVSGAPTVSIGGQPPVAIKVGDKLPVGSIITTDSASQLDIKPFEGTTTTIKAGSTVKIDKLSITTEGGVITKQSARFDLPVGNISSSLDHSKRAINDYSIKTPRGVAAARGTQDSVSVTPDGVATTVVTEGVVIFINPVTKQQVEVKAGFQVSVRPDGTIGEPVRSTEFNAPAENTITEKIDNTEQTTTRVIISNDTL